MLGDTARHLQIAYGYSREETEQPALALSGRIEMKMGHGDMPPLQATSRFK